MKELSMDERKKVELEIFEYVDKFCRENQITYFINFGTLLGAVRHGGFIPWDDDIDIMMPREDYERFIDLFTNRSHPYRLLEHRRDNVYYQDFTKVYDPRTLIIEHSAKIPYDHGVPIDIFPLESFDDYSVVKPLNYLALIRTYSLKTFRDNLRGDSKIKDILRVIIWALISWVPPKFYTNIIQRRIDKVTKLPGMYQGGLAQFDGERKIFPYGTFNELIEVPFEHMKVFAPKEYDKILAQYYGDYMTPPPVEEQSAPHAATAVWRD